MSRFGLPAALITAAVALNLHLSGISAVETRPAATEIDFNSQIRPILSDRCFFCHGPDGERREADLRLDLESTAKDSAIVAGDPDASELLRRIESDDLDERMPPSDSKLKLSPQEKKLIRDWIAAGAPWNDHWSFSPAKPRKAPPPKRAGWARGEIDRFVLHRLEAAGLEPAKEATPAQWIRRLSFDLTGLPPTPEEIQAFVRAVEEAQGDRGQIDKLYSDLVDRLLESESYGERMAAVWLDAARYSDTYGYQVDRDRFVWPYRDWVIRAFNRNLPFDQFATEQLAGDLLPEPTDDQILATTFNRLHPQKVEGGSVPEEFRVEYVADRTQTFATAFLGLTLECARCHDHKYDPLSQTEYYQLFAFFNNIDEAGLYSYFTPSVPTPTLPLVDGGAKSKLALKREAVRNAERDVQAAAEASGAGFAMWLKDQAGNWDAKQFADASAQVGALDFEAKPRGGNRSIAGVQGKGVRLSGDDGIEVKAGNFRRSQPFSVSIWMRTPDEMERAVVFHRSRAWTDAGSRGYQLLLEQGKLSASLIHFWPGNAIRVRAVEKLPLGVWKQVTMTYDGSSRAGGLKLFVDGKPIATEVVRDKLTKNITGGGGDNLRVGERFRDRGFKGGDVDELRVFQRELTSLEVENLHDDQAFEAALESAKQDPESASQRLADYYCRAIDAGWKAAATKLRGAREDYNKLADGLQEIMVMRELAQRRPTHRLHRGAYDSPAERVAPDAPAVLPPLPKSPAPNRLTLARWLTSTDHPLTSRVAVNRLWQICFGEGLVRTPEDFGSQGEPPTHPAMLDRLAYDFAHNGWDMKAMMKRIVTSSTYRQSTRPSSAQALEIDPENRLLGRMNSYRWPAEMVRDQALAVSGLLDANRGGPAAKPYELQHSFKPITPDKGAGLYRRSVYTFWKRTAPAPLMMTLDASKRDVCRVKRERTLSPLQSLVMLNGPQFVEASRIWAEGLTANHEKVSDQIAAAFLQLTGRPPDSEELSILESLYQQQLERFETDPDQAKKLLAVGEKKANEKLKPTSLAALAIVVNVVFNHDECIMKR